MVQKYVCGNEISRERLQMLLWVIVHWAGGFSRHQSLTYRANRGVPKQTPIWRVPATWPHNLRSLITLTCSIRNVVPYDRATGLHMTAVKPYLVNSWRSLFCWHGIALEAVWSLWSISSMGFSHFCTRQHTSTCDSRIGPKSSHGSIQAGVVNVSGGCAFVVNACTFETSPSEDTNLFNIYCSNSNFFRKNAK